MTFASLPLLDLSERKDFSQKQEKAGFLLPHPHLPPLLLNGQDKRLRNSDSPCMYLTDTLSVQVFSFPLQFL